MPVLRSSPGLTQRFLVVVACCAGIWYSWRLARADYLFHKDTTASIRAAIALVPDSWKYYMRLAQLDQGDSQNLLAAALSHNRHNAEADIEMGLQYEANGDFARAEHSLLQAYAVDHTYLPRWTLANYYFRRGNMPAFWIWARSAASMPSDNIGMLFVLCWRASPDARQITAAIANDQPKFLRQYLGFLETEDQPEEVAAIAKRLVLQGDPAGNRSTLLSAVNALVDDNDANAALSLWQILIERHWIVADETMPNNADFARTPLPVSFDWSLPQVSGMDSWAGQSALEAEFSGNEPESCTIAEQTISLKPGNYTLVYTYETINIAPDTGLHWQIAETGSKSILTTSSDLSSNELEDATLKFSVPQGASLLRLRLIYQRALGTAHISGTLVVRSVHIQPQPPS